MNTTLDYSTGDSRSRPWLKALFFIAGRLAVFPLGLGLFLLFYAFVLRMEGARDALWMGLAFTGASVAWIAGMRWLYRRVMVPVAGHAPVLHNPAMQRTGGDGTL